MPFAQEQWPGLPAPVFPKDDPEVRPEPRNTCLHLPGWLAGCLMLLLLQSKLLEYYAFPMNRSVKIDSK
jgi:hypothetical protein